jgi:hypothetical protein
MRIITKEIGCEIHAAPGERIGDCDPAEVVDLLREQAWVLFSGFEPTLEEFEAFSKRFGRCATPREIHYPPGGVALGFHAEDSYNPWRPDALWFLCLSAGDDGGTPTGVVDGAGLLEAMDAKWRTFSLENGLRFNRDWPASTWQAAVGGDKRDEVGAFLDGLAGLSHEFLADGTLRTRYDTPLVVRTQNGTDSFSNTMLHAITDHDYYGMTLTDGSPVPEDLLTHVEKLALEQELGVGWSDGDVGVIDNYRLMHRRAEYQGTGRELRALHGEELYGTPMPEAASPAARAVKEMLQGEEKLR